MEKCVIYCVSYDEKLQTDTFCVLCLLAVLDTNLNFLTHFVIVSLSLLAFSTAAALGNLVSDLAGLG